MAKPLLSFVIPCYRSANTIGAVVRELNDTLAARADEYDHEIILVNDGSPDDTADAIRELCARDPAIVFVDLSRNFGQNFETSKNHFLPCKMLSMESPEPDFSDPYAPELFKQVRGDIVICLDDDGQTPACECFKLIDKVAEGYDIVFAQYPKRRQSALRNLGSRFNAACNHYFFGQPRELTVNSYYACRRFVVDTALQYPNPFPYVTGLLFQSVSRYANVPVEHRARTEGRSGYNLKKLAALWLNGVTAFSIKPLRFASYAGWLTAVAGVVFALATVIRKLVNPDIPAGWASTISVLLLLGGMIIALIGVVGEYIGRIYLSINRSPQFVVRSVTRGAAEGIHQPEEREMNADEDHACGLGA